MENVEEMVDETIENEAADTQTAENPSGETEGGEQEETCEECSSEEEAEEESEETEETEKEKKGFFKKKKDKKDEQIEELTDKVKRQMAEFENFRKRSEKEKSQMFDLGAKTIIEKILPIVDNFERGFTTVEESDKEDAFVAGMSQVYKQLMTELEAVGVKPIEALGKEFDPEFHNAVMQVESEEYESGIVAQELMKGYTYKDTVVRHSMVAVVQ
ncbi:MAG: nucleotide exchange factor GrpE [Agathobacter sp.]|nr:nucleotide exchange factor GrpE [Agathobacter sp.]